MDGHFAVGQILVHYEQGVHFYQIIRYRRDGVAVQEIYKNKDGDIASRGNCKVIHPFYMQWEK